MTIEVSLKDIYNGNTILLKIPNDETQPTDELSNSSERSSLKFLSKSTSFTHTGEPR